MNYIGALAAGADKIIGFGDSPTVISTNATDWSYAAPGGATAFYGGANGGGYFHRCRRSGGRGNLAGWKYFYKNKSGTTENLLGAAYAKSGQFLAVGDNGTILVHQPLSISVSRSGGDSLVFNIAGMAGFNSVIESAATPASRLWQPLATNLLFSEFSSFTNNVSFSTNRFFRVRLN